jgi:hypothetical protein
MAATLLRIVYGAKEFQALLDSMSKKPSDHIKAWFEATLSEQKTIADTEVSGSDEFQTEAMAADIKPIIKDTDSFARKQVERIFNKINKEQWRGIFSREKNQNGIGIARTGPKGHPLYDLEKVSNWLKTYRPEDYTEADIKTAIQAYKEPILGVQVEKKQLKNSKPTKTQ